MFPLVKENYVRFLTTLLRYSSGIEALIFSKPTNEWWLVHAVCTVITTVNMKTSFYLLEKETTYPLVITHPLSHPPSLPYLAICPIEVLFYTFIYIESYVLMDSGPWI